MNIDKAPKVILINKVGEESQEWIGSIVRSEENVDPINRMVYVVAKVDDPYSLKNNNKTPLRRGTFLKATINGRIAKKIIAIPRTALRGKDRVWIAKDGKLIYRKVKPVYLDENLAIISEGIDSNEQIIVSLLAGVIDGMGIKIED